MFTIKRSIGCVRSPNNVHSLIPQGASEIIIIKVRLLIPHMQLKFLFLLVFLTTVIFLSIYPMARHMQSMILPVGFSGLMMGGRGLIVTGGLTVTGIVVEDAEE